MTVNINGKHYTVKGDAFSASFLYGDRGDYYMAHATCEETGNEDCEVYWRILEDWDPETGEDGACDWDNPEFVEEN